MSHSFKKTPGYVDRNPWWKNYYNRRIRHFDGDVGNGGWYKRVSEPWSICDWRTCYFNILDIEEHDRYLTKWHVKNNPLFAKSSYKYQMYMK